METAVVGMSGGVDSSVTALLLKQQGFRVIGMFMKNWEEKDANSVCRSSSDFEDVVQVCTQLDIPYYSVNFAQEYQDFVFHQFLEEFKQGHTPNPDILCNREIKFKVLLEKVLEIGGDFLATGHYCRNVFHEESYQLRKGTDPGKDQSYFLYTIGQKALSRVLFPVGHMLKPELRRLAQSHALATSNKKDSTGICFIGKRDFREFLGKYLAYQSGEFQTLNGKVVGEHEGAAYYTPGQRKGMGIGGPGEAWFVVGKEIARNIVYVEQGTLHPALYCDELIAVEPSWVSGAAPFFPWACKAKVRYRQPDQDCVVTEEKNGMLRVRFAIPQRAVTPRQSVVFYDGENCLGGAMIQSAGPSYYHQGRALPEDVSP